MHHRASVYIFISCTCGGYYHHQPLRHGPYQFQRTFQSENITFCFGNKVFMLGLRELFIDLWDRWPRLMASRVLPCGHFLAYSLHFSQSISQDKCIRRARRNLLMYFSINNWNKPKKKKIRKYSYSSRYARARVVVDVEASAVRFFFSPTNCVSGCEETHRATFSVNWRINYQLCWRKLSAQILSLEKWTTATSRAYSKCWSFFFEIFRWVNKTIVYTNYEFMWMWTTSAVYCI